MANTQLAQKIEAAYEPIHAEWEIAMQNTLVSGLVCLMLDTLDESLKGTLQFSVLQGIISQAHLWSPYGPPLPTSNKDREKEQGVIFYISGVAKDVLSSIPSYSMKPPTMEQLLTYAKIHYEDRITQMGVKWNEIKDSHQVMSKSELSKISLISMIQNLKDKRAVGNAVSTFVNAFIYLPHLLPKDKNTNKQVKSWAMGCCTSLLDSMYEADLDWKNNAKALWKIKISLAKDRWIKTPRSSNAMYVATKHKKKHKEVKENNLTLNKIKIDLHVEHYDEQEDRDATSTNVLLQEPFSTYISNNDAIKLIAEPTIIDNLINEILNTNNVLSRKQTLVVSSVMDRLTCVSEVSSIISRLSINMNTYKQSNASDILNKMKQSLFSPYLTLSQAKYILTLAICVPARVYITPTITIDLDETNDVPFQEILTKHVNTFEVWKQTHTIMSPTEIQEYMNNKREEQKNIVLAKYNVLNVDDLQLMKDAKRFKLKTRQE
jgi:hypothetical protein